MTTDEDRRRASATTAAVSGCGGESAQAVSAHAATSEAQAAVSSEWRMMTSQVTHRRPAARPARCPQECERSGASWLCVADFRRVCLAHPDTDGPPSACSGRREMCTCGVSAPADCPMRRTARADPNDGRRQRGHAPPETSQASSLQLLDFRHAGGGGTKPPESRHSIGDKSRNHRRYSAPSMRITAGRVRMRIETSRANDHSAM